MGKVLAVVRHVIVWASAFALVVVGQAPAAASPIKAEGAAGMSQSVVSDSAVQSNLGMVETPIVQITTSLASVNAGQSFTVTTTSSLAATTALPITIIDFTRGVTLKTCTTGTTCSVTTSFISLEPREYLARHGQTETSPVTVAPIPWNLTLSTSRELITAGEGYNIDLVTSQNPATVSSVWGVRIVKVGTSTTMKECTSTTSVTGGYQCRVSTTWFSLGSKEFRGELYDKATGEVLAASNVTIVTSTPWVLSVQTSTPQVGPDGKATLTVHSNQQVYSIRTLYIVHVIDENTGAVVKTCSNLTAVGSDFTCTAIVSATPGTEGRFYAVVAPPTTPNVKRISTSNMASVFADAWTVRLEVDRPVVSIEQNYNLRVYTNGNPASATPKSKIYILDQGTGAVISTCVSGGVTPSGESVCSWDSHADPAVKAHSYIAVVASPTSSSVDVAATSNIVTVSPMPWEIVWERAEFNTQPLRVAFLHSISSQSVFQTAGHYAIYIESVPSGEIIKTCLGSVFELNTLSRCQSSLSFDDTLTAQSMRAFVAPADDPYGTRLAETSVHLVSRSPLQAVLGRGQGTNCSSENPVLEFFGATDYDIRGSSYHAVFHTPDGEGFTAYYYGPWKFYDSHTSCESRGFYYYTVDGYQNGMTDRIATSNGVFYPSGAGAYEFAGGGNPAEECVQTCTGDPINTATGEFYETNVDLQMSGMGPSLVWARTYSSAQASQDTGQGYGWVTNDQMRITVLAGTDLETATYVSVTQENGSYVDFGRASDGAWIAPPRVFAELTSNPDGTLTFVRKRNEVFTFSSTGVLVSAADLNGNAISMSYDAAGRLSRMDSTDGRWIEVARDANGRVASVSDSLSRSVSYTYDAQGNLVMVAGSGGNTATYAYDTLHRVVSLTPPASGSTTNQYNVAGRVIKQVAPDGGITSISYGTSSTTITQPDGSKVFETYDEGRLVARTVGYGTPLAATTSFTYTSRNQVASVTDPAGRISTFVYNSVGNLRQMIDSGGQITTYDYDLDNNLVTVRNALSSEVSFEYDELGNIVAGEDAIGNSFMYTLDSHGRRTSTTDPYGNSSSVTYDEFSNPEETVSPAGVRSVVEADALGRVTRTWDPRAWLPGADPSDYDTTFAYGPQGLLESVTDPTGATVTTEYDLAGRATSMTDALGREATVEYDSSGRPVVMTDAAGRETTYTYDLMSRITSITGPEGSTTTATYDALGRVSTITGAEGGVTSYSYNVSDQPLTMTDPDGRVWQHRYDARGRLEATIDPLGAETLYVSDSLGRVTQVTDPVGRVTTYEYDAAGRVVRIQRSDDSVQTTTYDALGRVVATTDSSGRTATYTYDPEGRVLTSVDILGRETTYQYEAGYLTSTTGPDGVTTTIEYDARGYAVESSTGASHEVSVNIDAVGRVTSSVEPAGTTTYTYDVLDRLLGVDGPTGDVVFGYDLAGNLDSITYPSGRVVSREHDLLGRLLSVSSTDVGSIDFTWTAGGSLDGMTFPNDVTTDVGFDGAGRVNSIDVTGSSGSILSLDYTMSADGRLSGRETQRGSATAVVESFVADSLGRVSPSVNGAPSATFTPSHEVTALPDGTTVSYSALGVPEVVTSAGVATTLMHNTAGQRVEESVGGSPVADYTWNDLGQLTAVADTRAGVDVAYEYAGGLRTGASGTGVSGAVDATYVWDAAAGVPLLLSDGEHEFIYGTGTAPIAQVEISTGEVSFLHGDLVGSTRTVTDASGVVVAEYDYSLYGERSVVSGDSDVTRFLFAGEYVDPAGDYYLRNRVYDPESAGFLSVDPVVGATGMPFAYTGGNPLQGTDPLGLFGLGDIGGWLGDGVGWIADRAGDVWDYVTSPEGFAATITYTGCLFLTGGLGVVGCSAVSGAVYGALEYGANVPMECWSVSDFFKTTATFALWGAGLGVLFGPMSSVAGSWMRAAVNRVAPTWLKQSVGTAFQSTKAAVTQFGQAVKQRAGNGLTQFRAAGERGSIGLSSAANTGPGIFRGAKPGESPSFAPKPGEFKVDPQTGFVRDTRGVSVYDNPGSVTNRRLNPYLVDSTTIPPELRVIQQGVDPHHFEIVPRPGVNLTPEEFTSCLFQIQCGR